MQTIGIKGAVLNVIQCSLRSILATAFVAIVCLIQPTIASATSCSPSGSYSFIYPSGSAIYETNNPYGDEGDSTTGTCVVNTAVYAESNLAWYTQWNQPTGETYNVYSYPEAIFDNSYSYTNLPRTLSSITSIPSTWNYGLSASDSTGYDVAYDVWVYPTSSATGTPTAEVMIWTAANFGQDGTNVGTYTIDGIPFTLYQTLPADYSWTTHPVYSFVAQNSVSYISGDLKQFLTTLTNNGYISTSTYLTSIDVGVEVRGTSGTGSLSTYDYSVYVNY
nr:hypothetical protein [Granulicella arctica]